MKIFIKCNTLLQAPQTILNAIKFCPDDSEWFCLVLIDISTRTWSCAIYPGHLVKSQGLFLRNLRSRMGNGFLKPQSWLVLSHRYRSTKVWRRQEDWGETDAVNGHSGLVTAATLPAQLLCGALALEMREPSEQVSWYYVHIKSKQSWSEDFGYTYSSVFMTTI